MTRIVIAVVIAAVAVIGMVAYSQAKDDGGADGVSDAPPLTGTTLDGQPFDLADARGTPAVVNFFFPSCPGCHVEAPDLVAVSVAHPDVTFVGVGAGFRDSQAETEAFVDKYGIGFPVVYDENDEISEAWGVTLYPATFFVDAEGVVQESIVGAATYDQFEAALETVL